MNYFAKGLKNGIPIGLGYFAVAFSFGIMAVRAGLGADEAVLISLTNLTSAGQAAGVDVISEHGSLAEMALVQFVINIRYALMAISLSQKTAESFTVPCRLLGAHFITDEIFAVCYSVEGKLVPRFMYGVAAVAVSGWTLGTLFGATMGQVLPSDITAALGVMLYGMFIAIIIPPSKKKRDVLFSVVLAAVLNIILRKLPLVSSGLSVILSAVLSAGVTVFVFKGEGEK